MKDEKARIAIGILEERLKNLEARAVVSCHCPKCGCRTAHEYTYVKVVDGKYYEVPETLPDCTGLHVEPSRRCLSCNTVYILTQPTEVQLEEEQ